MRRTLTLPLSVILAALMITLSMVGGARATAPARVDGDMLLLRAGANAGGDMVSLPGGGAAHHLPLGLLASHGSVLYTASAAASGLSLFRALDARSGRVLRSLVLPGAYSTSTGDYSATTLSYNGLWQALRATTAPAGTTRAIVVNTATMKVAATLTLPGRFGLDAVDGQGAVLYLIERLARPGDHPYRVRSYQIGQGMLDDQPVLDKSAPDPASATMSGVAWTRVWSPDGAWLYTLYIYTQPGGKAGAFVHALSVVNRIAHCIDLPDNGAAGADLAHYTLAVSADGATLYAVNPVLGRLRVVHGLPFGEIRKADLGQRAGSARRSLGGAVLSGDGRHLFVVTMRGVWTLDAATLALSAVHLPGVAVTSLALNSTGRLLYALEPEHNRGQALDPATGRVIATLPTASDAWAIAAIMDKR